MRLYDDLAEWWPLLDDPATAYAVEANLYADLLAEACDGPIESLLELGSGGGNNALHMKRRFPHLLLTDVSDGMLAEVGFDARSVPFVHPDVEPGRHEMFVGRRRGSPTGRSRS